MLESWGTGKAEAYASRAVCIRTWNSGGAKYLFSVLTNLAIVVLSTSSMVLSKNLVFSVSILCRADWFWPNFQNFKSWSCIGIEENMSTSINFLQHVNMVENVPNMHISKNPSGSKHIQTKKNFLYPWTFVGSIKLFKFYYRI